MISVHYQIEQQPLEQKLSEIRSRATANFRRRLVQEVLERTVQKVIDRHPVDTGRARDAWKSAIQQAGTKSNILNDQHRTTAEVTNHVDYVVFLEEGTRRMRPYHMVSRSLAEVPLYLSQLTGQLFNEEIVSP